MFVQRTRFHSKPECIFYFGILSTREIQTLSIPRLLFVFYSLITHVHKISITCKFSWLSNLSFSVVLTNWKSKPTHLCLGLYELFSEDIHTPSSPQVTFHTICIPLVFYFYLAVSELYIRIPLWLVLQLCAILLEMDVFLKSSCWLASLHIFLWKSWLRIRQFNWRWCMMLSCD